jgi:phage gp36-like protein
MPSSTDITLLTSEARTVSGVGVSVDLGNRTGLTLDLAILAVDGTSPTLDVSIETSKDEATWRTLDAFERVTTPGPVARAFAGADRYVRARWTLGGTDPSITFGLAGQALLLYATPEDVAKLGVAAEALAAIPRSTLAEHLIANVDDIDDKLCKRFALPLTRWPSSLRKHLAAITAWTALSNRGVNPGTGDKDIQLRHDKAWKDVLDLAENRAGSTDGYVDSTPAVIDDGVYVWGRPRRR